MAIAPRMTLFMFTSNTSQELNAFAATSSGVALPEKFAPWQLTGKVLPDRAPPHGFSRAAIEKSIAATGFQLWRRRKTEEELAEEARLAAEKAAAKKPARKAKAAAKPKPEPEAEPEAKEPAAE
jgi:hypothetical protein